MQIATRPLARLRRGTRLALQVLVALLLTVTVTAQNRPREPRLQGDGTLKVMTYNMYVGSKYAGMTTSDPDALKQAVTNLILDARASDPAERIAVIAQQIADTEPHLVSLQEVATWSTGPSPAELEVEFDFLPMLLDALAARGLSYAPVASLTHFSATLLGSLGYYVRSTMGVAVIARADLAPEDFYFGNVQTATWDALLQIPMPALGQLVPFPRGWISTDVMYRGKALRFIAAHLDRSSAYEVAQGWELLLGPADTTLPVVVAADMNADAANPAHATYQTYLNMLNAGFVDAWVEANPGDPGFTKDLPNMTRRGDFVFARGRFKVQAAALAGEEDPADKTPGGLWASDHCGVVARLQLPEDAK